MRVRFDGIEYRVSFDRTIAGFEARNASTDAIITDPITLAHLYQGQAVFDFATRMIGGSSSILRENVASAEATIDAFKKVEVWQLIYDALIAAGDFALSPKKSEAIASFAIEEGLDQATNVLYFWLLNKTVNSAKDELSSAERQFEPASRADAGFGVVDNETLVALAAPIMKVHANLLQNYQLIQEYDNFETQPWWQGFWDIATTSLKNFVSALDIRNAGVPQEAVVNLTRMQKLAKNLANVELGLTVFTKATDLGDVLYDWLSAFENEIDAAELTSATPAGLLDFQEKFEERFPDVPVEDPTPRPPPPVVTPEPSDRIPIPDNDPDPPALPPATTPGDWSVPEGDRNYDLSARGADAELRPGESIPLGDLFPSRYWSDSDGIEDILFFAVRDRSDGGGYLEFQGERMQEGSNSHVYNRPLFELDEWKFVAAQEADRDDIGFNIIQADGDYSASAVARVTTLERELADLVIEDVEFDGDRIGFGDKLARVFEAGDSLSVQFDVSNIGPGDSGESTAGIWIFDGDEFIEMDTEDVRSIDSGRSDTNERLSFRIPDNLDRGVYSAFILPDIQDTVAEEGDDTAGESGGFAFLFELDEIAPGLPDLVARNVSVSETALSAGATITVSYEIANIGNGPAGDTRAGIYLSDNSGISTGDTLIGSQRSSRSDDPNDVDSESETVSLPSDLAPGRYHIGVIADHDDTESEIYEGNNESSDSANDGAGLTITIAPPPNEAPADLKLSARIVSEAAPVGFALAAVSAIDPDADALSYSLAEDAGGRFVLAGTRLEVNRPLDYEAATSHDIRLRAEDPEGAAVEETFTITVANEDETPPALNLSVFPSTAVPPPALYQGTATEHLLRIRSDGPAPPPAGVEIQSFLSTDRTLDSGDRLVAEHSFTAFEPESDGFDFTVALATKNLEVPVDQPIGTYNLIHHVDPKNLVTESDEEDNVHVEGTVTVSANSPSEPVTPDDATHRVAGQVQTHGGDPFPGVKLSFRPNDTGAPAIETASIANGSFEVMIDDGMRGHLAARQDYDAATDPLITAEDALEILRLAVDLEPSWGPADAFDFIAADVDRSGDVTAFDALEVLRHAVGLESDYAPGWVFIDGGAQLDAIQRENVAYDTGINLAAVNADMQPSMSGVLLGDLAEYG